MHYGCVWFPDHRRFNDPVLLVHYVALPLAMRRADKQSVHGSASRNQGCTGLIFPVRNDRYWSRIIEVPQWPPRHPYYNAERPNSMYKFQNSSRSMKERSCTRSQPGIVSAAEVRASTMAHSTCAALPDLTIEVDFRDLRLKPQAVADSVSYDGIR